MASRRPVANDDGEDVIPIRTAPPVAATMAVDQSRSNRVLECRSFWKAGGYEAPTSGISNAAENEILGLSDFDCARVHPKFLHTNATSHKWAFGAVAELLDNAVDEISNGATFIKVDKINNPKDYSPMLLFQDNGGGMDPDGIRKCMSLGFSSKRSKTTIGQYGNGFKTSTMRLGADAIVFSRAIRESRVTMCIGLLSYTYLRRTMKDDIVIPMLDFEVINGQPVPLVSSSQEDWDYSLKTILEWSPFSADDDLLLQFEDVGLHGTKVLIYNLWMDDDGLLELDFDDDDEDILLRDQANYGGFTKFDKEIVKSHISYTLKYSLRAYTSILYLRKFSDFQIILRGKPVEQLRISDEMKFKKTSTYKPQVGVGSQDVSVRITVGFAKEAPVLGIFGLNVYHRNRLIMPFWKVLQEGSSRGRSVIGYLEANFIEPAHDKQDFERTPLFNRLETKLRQIILDYWKNNCHLVGYQSLATTTEKQRLRKPGQKLHNKVPSSSNLKGPSASLDHELEDEVQVNGQVAGHRTNELNTHVTEVAAADGSPVPTGRQQPIMEEVDSGEEFEGLGTLDVTDPSIIEKITEENLQLFLRREEFQQKEAELRKIIRELEQELEETKKRCSHLTLKLDIKKKELLK